METYYTLAVIGKEKEAVQAVRDNNGFPPSLKISVRTITKNYKNRLKLLAIIVR